MNFDLLLELSEKNWKNLNLNQKILLKKWIYYNLYLLNWKRKKLKLGLVFFEIKSFYIYNILIFENVEMIYIRQDNTLINELKLENRLKKLNWKWDLNNILALVIVLSFFFFKIYLIFLPFYNFIFFNLINKEQLFFLSTLIDLFNINFFTYLNNFNSFIGNILIKFIFYQNILI